MAERDRHSDMEWLYGKSASQDPMKAKPSASSRRSVPPGQRSGQKSSNPDRPRIVGVEHHDENSYAINGRKPAVASPAKTPDRPRVTTASYSSELPVSPHREKRARAHGATYKAGDVRAVERREGRRRSHPSAAPSQSAKFSSRSGKFSLKKIFFSVFAIFFAWIIYLVAVPIYTVLTMSSVDAHPLITSPEGDAGHAILLVGSDSRAGLDEAEKQRLGTGDAAGSRADTIMMLYRPVRGESVLISLPRDSYVSIPDYGMDKLNASYSYGGPPLLVTTIEQTTGIALDGYVEIGFGGFSSLVDAVGGIEVCLDEPMQDELTHIDLPVGCQIIDGTQALGYVRMRYQDPRGDIGRAERQREVVGKVMNKLLSPASVINPIRYWKINRAAAEMIVKSDETSSLTLFAAAMGLRSVASGQGTSLVVPIADPAGWTESGASVVIWDSQAAGELFAQIATGDTSDIERFR